MDQHLNIKIRGGMLESDRISLTRYLNELIYTQNLSIIKLKDIYLTILNLFNKYKDRHYNISITIDSSIDNILKPYFNKYTKFDDMAELSAILDDFLIKLYNIIQKKYINITLSNNQKTKPLGKHNFIFSSKTNTNNAPSSQDIKEDSRESIPLSRPKSRFTIKEVPREIPPPQLDIREVIPPSGSKSRFTIKQVSREIPSPQLDSRESLSSIPPPLQLDPRESLSSIPPPPQLDPRESTSTKSRFAIKQVPRETPPPQDNIQSYNEPFGPYKIRIISSQPNNK